MGEGISLSDSGTSAERLTKEAGISSLVSFGGLCERSKERDGHFRGSFLGDSSAGDGMAAPWNISGRRTAMGGVKEGSLAFI